MIVAFLVGGFCGIELYFLMKSKVFILVGFGYIMIACVYFFLRHRCNVLCMSSEGYPFK